MREPGRSWCPRYQPAGSEFSRGPRLFNPSGLEQGFDLSVLAVQSSLLSRPGWGLDRLVARLCNLAGVGLLRSVTGLLSWAEEPSHHKQHNPTGHGDGGIDCLLAPADSQDPADQFLASIHQKLHQPEEPGADGECRNTDPTEQTPPAASAGEGQCAKECGQYRYDHGGYQWKLHTLNPATGLVKEPEMSRGCRQTAGVMFVLVSTRGQLEGVANRVGLGAG